MSKIEDAVTIAIAAIARCHSPGLLFDIEEARKIGDNLLEQAKQYADERERIGYNDCVRTISGLLKINTINWEHPTMPVSKADTTVVMEEKADVRETIIETCHRAAVDILGYDWSPKDATVAEAAGSKAKNIVESEVRKAENAMVDRCAKMLHQEAGYIFPGAKYGGMLGDAFQSDLSRLEKAINTLKSEESGGDDV